MLKVGRVSASVAVTLALAACLPNSTVAADKQADKGPVKPAVAEDIKKKLAERLPNVKIDSVANTPISGLYEVVVNKRDIVYVDREAKYLMDGNLVDLSVRKSLTEERAADLRRVDFGTLPFDDAIKVVKGKGERKLAVFSDPDCPFCKRLEASLKDMDNVTIYTFLYPLAQLHPDAPRKSALVWCAADRVSAWNALMHEGKLPEGEGKCDTPLAKIASLAEQYGISGTPGIVFPNGKLVPGAISREQIEKELGAGK
ncbi:thiol:disulfide interchange protein DsbC [Chitinivorax tropicus]|uniref:Thiol:disulfide interchange protein n=1 Tax=Chitinivorax tropicus TaxID=714531 RepID=A0A840MQ79_9PROT|nr:DsbC family protein [Chitinivorax tropicus]MBB5019239.1 thiol:disulfide interchange protein DsbC [Chitinivorax tropicus]